eukprot:2298693-Lingulodinium_polyedra.AAC.1
MDDAPSAGSQAAPAQQPNARALWSSRLSGAAQLPREQLLALRTDAEAASSRAVARAARQPA